MDPKAKKSIFFEYRIEVQGYGVYDTKTLKVFHGIDVIFNEPASIDEQRREEIVSWPLLEVEYQYICDDDDDSETSHENQQDHEDYENSTSNGSTMLSI